MVRFCWLFVVFVSLALVGCTRPLSSQPATVDTAFPSISVVVTTASTSAPTPSDIARPTARSTATAALPASPTLMASPAWIPTPSLERVPTLSALPPGHTPAPALDGVLISTTVHLDLYAVNGGLPPGVVQSLAPRFEAALAQVAARLGATPRGRTSIRFAPPQQGPCALRGLTRSAQRSIELYYAPTADADAVLRIVAHELAHQLQNDRYGAAAQQRADTILLEGVAVWASDTGDGDVVPRWQRQVEVARAERAIQPLTTDLGADCRQTTRIALYSQWASFVQFLLDAYGRDALDRAYASGVGRAPGSAQYADVYGVPFAQLEAEWKKAVEDALGSVTP